MGPHPRTADRVGNRYVDLVNRGRLEEAESLIQPDLERVDHGSLATPPQVGRDAYEEDLAAMGAVGFRGVERTSIAVRGERLALARLTLRTPDGFEKVKLNLIEIGDDGRIRFDGHWDEEDLPAALGALNARYFFGEGAPHQRVLTVCAKFGSASLRDDTEALADLVAPSFVFADRRLLGYGEGDRRYLIDARYNGLDRVDGSVVNRVLYPVGGALLAVQRWMAISETGSEFEQVTCFVLHVDESGLIDRVESVRRSGLSGRGSRRVDELAGQAAPDRRAARIENAATRADARAAELIARGDDAALAGSALADGFVLEDRRSVVALPDLDARGLAENFAAMRAQGYTIQTPEPLSVRGDRLCLSRRVATTEGGDESPVLALTELDEQGRYRSVVFFDADDLSAAMTELDDRYLADEGARHSRVLRVCRAFGDANDRRDFDAMREMLAPDFVMSDRTRLGYGEGDREYFDAASRTRADVAPSDGVSINRLLVIEGDTLLTVAEGHHITAEGSDYAWVSCIVFQVDDDDRIRRAEYFDEDDFDTAMARLHELGVADARTPHAENTTTQLMARSVELATARRFDLLRELFADDFVRADHRMGVSAPVANGPDEFVTAYASWFEVGFDHLSIVPIAVRGDRLALTRMEWTSADGRSVPFLGLYETNADGHCVRGEHFDGEDLAVALEAIDERFVADQDPADATTLRAGNEVVRLYRAHDWDGHRELLADGFVAVDHRTIGLGTTDRDGYISFLRDYAEVVAEMSTIAVTVHCRGRVVLTSNVASATTLDGAPWEYALHSLLVVDGAGRVERMEWFDPDDWDPALARLDELGATPTAVGPVNAVTRLLAQLLDLMNRGDNAAAFALDAVATDVVRFDRRHTVAAPTVVDGAGFIENAIAIYEVFGVVRPEPIAVRGDRLALIRLHCGERDGFPMRLLVVYELDVDGRICWEADYDDEQLDEALDELNDRYHGTVDPTVTNRAAEVLIRAGALLMTDLEAALDLVADDAESENRQAGPLHGIAASTRDGWRTALVSWAATYDTLWFEPVAVRGERVALLRYEFASDGFVTRAQCVVELDTNGLVQRLVNFDDDDLDAALDELDERYLAGEGAEHEYPVRRLGDFRTAQAGLDWDAVEALVADDFRFVDHRPMGLPENDRAGYVGVMRASEEQTPGVRMIHRSLDVLGDVVLSRTGRVGATPDGLEYEWEQIAVMVWAGGLLRRVELFPVTDGAAARTRFEELARRGRITPYVDNRLVRIGVRAQWFGRFTDERPQFYRDDCVLDDRRPGVNAGTVHGAEAVGASIQSGVDVFGVLEIDWLAVRGDRLALNRWAFVADGGFEAPGVSVIEMDEDDLVCRVTSFQESDLAAAVEFLEARHAELRGDALSVHERAIAAGEVAFNAPRLGTRSQRCSSPASTTRTTPGSAEVGLGTSTSRTCGPSSSRYPTSRWSTPRSPRRVGRACRSRPRPARRWTAPGTPGVSSGSSSPTVPAGSRGSSQFADDQWDDAVACFDRRAAESQAAPRAAPVTSVENAASRRTALAAREFGMEEKGSAHHADDLVRVDHRRMIGVPTTTTRNEFADAARAFADVGMTDLTFETLAVRGDRCCLGRLTYSGADFDVAFLTVVACNVRDEMASIDNFDDDDLATALETLDERWIAGEAAEYGYLIRRIQDVAWSITHSDRRPYEDLYTPDCVVANHRRLGWPLRSLGDVVESAEAMDGIVATRSTILRSVECDRDAVLALQEQMFVTPEGNEYSSALAVVARLRAGRFDVLETFDPDDPAARVRFAELAKEPRASYVDNDAVRVHERFAWFGGHEDVDGARALLAPDLLAIDRRPGVAAPDMVGPDARLANLAAVGEVFDRIDSEVVAARGDRLMLLRWAISADGFATSGYDVTEIDPEGRICRIVTFDESQHADAIDELEQRHAALAAGPADVVPIPASQPASLAQSLSSAFAARDWEWLRGRVAPDATVEDRRSTVSSHRVVGAEAVSALFRGFADVGFETLDNIHVASRGDHLVLLRRVYRSAAGFELEMLAVVETDADGLMASLVLFDVDAMVPALDELEIRYARSGRLGAVERQVVLGFVAVNHRAWNELDAVLAPDVSVVDHRRLGFPAGVGKEPLIHELQSLVEQVPDVIVIIERLEGAGRAVLAENHQVGTSTDGLAVDWQWYLVFSLNRDGLLELMEYFDADDGGAAGARARFEELAGRDA